ncbi:MAG TPA: hypothetical protein VGK54_09425 [Chloroflexota bacterium]
MVKARKKNTTRGVLHYSRTGPARATVWRHYLRWRREQNPPLPVRCDKQVCFFHSSPLVWNGKPLKPILDHVEGNNTDNRPEMLWLLCPNCDSQQPTQGGANRGRIQKSEGGFAKVSRDGKRDYILPAEGRGYSLSGGEAKLTVAAKGRKRRFPEGDRS